MSEFTEQRKKDIAEAREEIAYLHNIMGNCAVTNPTHCINRILAREQSHLASLLEGAKEGAA